MYVNNLEQLIVSSETKVRANISEPDSNPSPVPAYMMDKQNEPMIDVVSASSSIFTSGVSSNKLGSFLRQG